MTDGRTRSGKATAEKMTAEQRKERAMKGVEARKEKAELPKVIFKNNPLNLIGASIPCAVIQWPDGKVKRVLSENGILTSIYGQSGMASGASKRAKIKALENDEAPMPLFLSPARLKPLIYKVHGAAALLNKITYIDSDSSLASGYDAEVLPKICEIWLMARDEGILQEQQLSKAKKAELLMRALAHVGVAALVDEATGYQDARAKDALAKVFEAFIAKELQPWVKTFPDDYYKELFRLYDLPYPPKDNKVARPQFFGKVTNKVIYKKLAPEILPELKKQAQKYAKNTKLHQTLTPEKGHPDLLRLVSSVTTIMKLSKTKEEFFEKVDIIHPDFNENYALDFDA